MKRIYTALMLLMTAPVLRADDLSNNFSANLTEQNLDVLAKDMGALVGAGSFHHGKALGFPLGFDVGVHVPVVGVHDDDAILRDDDSSVIATWGQVEVGLPARINVIGRIGKVEDADMLGGGLRFGILQPSVPGLPSLSISALYSELDHDYFDMTTYSANAVLSIDFPFIDPYIGGGYDASTLTPTTQAFVGVPASVSRGTEGKANGTRAEIGINLHLIPFTYLNAGVGLANGEEMYHGGAGIRF